MPPSTFQKVYYLGVTHPWLMPYFLIVIKKKPSDPSHLPSPHCRLSDLHEHFKNGKIVLTLEKEILSSYDYVFE